MANPAANKLRRVTAVFIASLLLPSVFGAAFAQPIAGATEYRIFESGITVASGNQAPGGLAGSAMRRFFSFLRNGLAVNRFQNVTDTKSRFGTREPVILE
jgi:hypothetical protein